MCVFEWANLIKPSLANVKTIRHFENMKSLPRHWRWMLPLSWLLLSGQAGSCFNPPASLSAEEIVRKAVVHAQAVKADRRRAGYAYTKQVVVEDLDTRGRITETKEKVFQFTSGLGSLEQIKINGRVADGAQLKKEEDRTLREGPQLGDAKTAKRDDHWEKYLTPELVSKYHFTLLERKLLNGRPTYVIRFQPLSGVLPVRQMADRLLNQLTGTIWIDEQEFEIARADICAQSKVTLGGVMEVLGSLKKFTFALERIRLEEGIWFNRLASGDFEGRKLLDTTHVKTRSETSNFHKASAEKN